MVNSATPYIVILSAERSNKTAAENRARTARMAWGLTYLVHFKDIEKFTDSLGMYEGVSEASYVVHCSNIASVLYMADLAREYNQDSILVLSPSTLEGRPAELVYLNECRSENIGTFKKAPADYNGDAYTIIDGVKYTCE